MQSLGRPTDANRLGLEFDRINNDFSGAQTRCSSALAYPGFRAVAQRYFPQLLEVGAATTLKATTVKAATLKAAIGAPKPEQAFAAHLYVLGSIKLEYQNQAATSPALQGKVMLALLLEARITGRDGVKALELLDTLYPDQDETRGLGALKQLVFRLRSSLGKGAILRINDGYALGEIGSDAETFLQTRATHLWRGPLLNDIEEDIAMNLRDALNQALKISVENLLEHDASEAVRLGEILLETNPYETDVLALLIRALQASNDSRKLERVYAQARDQFTDVSEQLPASWEAFLQNRI